MNNKRLYKKIMNHINKRTNCSTWYFRTLNICYPHLAEQIFILLQDHYTNLYNDEIQGNFELSNQIIRNSYVPQNIF